MVPFPRYTVFALAALLAVSSGCTKTQQPVTAAPGPSITANTQTEPTSGVDTHSSQPELAALPVVVAFGDSLTAGFGLNTGQSYPDFLQRDLARDGYHVRIVNLGVSGNTTKDGVDRLGDALRLKPAAAIVAFGGNDGLRGIPVGVMQKNLSIILTAFQRAHVPVVIGGITMPPNYGQDYVSHFNAVFPQLATQYKAPLLPMMLTGIWNDPRLLQPDGIHPTAAGAEILAKNFVPLVEPLLKKN